MFTYAVTPRSCPWRRESPMPDHDDEPGPRRLLPLLDTDRGGRSAMTCRYRCADACAHEPPNTSGNAYFGDVVQAAVSRRGLLRGGAAAAVVVGAGALTRGPPPA